MASPADRLTAYGECVADHSRTILLCSCEDTMSLDAGAVARGNRGARVVSGRELCRAEMERARTSLAEGTPVTIACTQEAPLFSEVAAEKGRTSPIGYANLREMAGWSSNAAEAGPKMAALLAAAAEPVSDVPLIDVESGNVVLIYGRGEEAVEAAGIQR